MFVCATASEQTISQLKNDIREQKARYAQLATKSALSDRDMQAFIAGKLFKNSLTVKSGFFLHKSFGSLHVPFLGDVVKDVFHLLCPFGL